MEPVQIFWLRVKVRQMKRNSTRIFWMTDPSWYTIVDGKFQLTDMAPERAKRSFAEWNKPDRKSIRTKLREMRCKMEDAFYG